MHAEDWYEEFYRAESTPTLFGKPKDKVVKATSGTESALASCRGHLERRVSVCVHRADGMKAGFFRYETFGARPSC
jgi:hypothetical protein